MADRADMADRANSRVILPTIPYIDGKSEIIIHWLTDSLTHWQHQLQGDAIASKNTLIWFLIVYQQMRWSKPKFLQVLVTMFTTVLSNTPSEPKGLTALAIWILGSLILVFIALVLYVVILVSLMRLARKTKSELPGFSEENNHVDFDSAFLLAHPILFAIFVVVYALAVFVWNGFNCLTSFGLPPVKCWFNCHCVIVV